MIRRILETFETNGLGVPYQGVFDSELVLLSIAIAIIAAFVALSLASRIAAATSPWERWAWTGAGAFSMGGGIWAMHFIGMLAFSLPCGESYSALGTVLSMIPGILASGVALRLIGSSREPGFVRLIGGAVLMGAGIGAMHYSGMAAMEPQALLRYEPVLFAVSVIVAVALAFVSLAIRFHMRRYRVSDMVAAMVAAPVMGLAVACMHYTAMKAAVFFPVSDTLPSGLMLPTTLMATLIAVISLLIAGVALAGSVAGHQSEFASGLRAEITRRQAAEQSAEGGRARLQAIFDAVADAIVTIDKDGHIQQWSSGAQRIFGYLPEEVVGANLTILMPEPHGSRHAGYIGSFLKTRDAKIIGIGRELTAIRKDGSEFPIELTVSEVCNGEEVFFTGILRDITERKRTEAELVGAREKAEAANLAKSQFLATMSHEIRTPMNGVLGMANLLALTALNDRQQRLVDNVSRSGQALLGIINDILDFAKIESGKFEFSSVAFEPRETIAEMAELFSERCAKKGLEFVYFIAEDVPEMLVGDPMRLRQILVNLVGNAVKFTERGEILVEVSLARKEADAVVMNFAIEDTGIGIPPDQRASIFESFQQIDGSLTRARGGSGLGLAITRQLVDLMGGEISVESEPGRGSRFSFTTRFQPSSLTEELPRGARHLARPLRTLLADANAISAHVISLYLASWDVDATVVTTLAEAKAARLDAADAGTPFDVVILDIKGLDPEAPEFAAQIRSDVEARRSELILLTGLDTYMVDSNLETLGPAAILPKPARPSELFSALVSISHGSKAAWLAPSAKRRGLHAGLPSFDARILIAEDNPVNQDVASGVLELMGCRTVSAPNGRAAFRLFAQEKFDAILMDCEMPIMDGIEATHRIRELEAMQQGLADSDQGKQRIPIIASTAHAISEVREKCLAAGMDDFLVKPYDERQMAETLLRWLKPRGGEATINPANQADPAVEDATSPTQDDVIDRAVIDGLRAMAPPGRRSPFGRALARFLETTPPIVASIRDNCDKSDAEALWRGAHYLKSSASALGAKQLSLRCAEIESRARDSGIDTARPLVEFLDDDLAAAISGLKAVAGTFMNLPDTDDAVALAGAPTLLIVDDDPVVRSLMRDALEDDGFTVIEAENGIEACQLCEAAVPALLVVDAVMPVMDGFELCRALRQQPQTAQVPILMATGLDDPGSIARAYEVGATDFIAKPLNWLMLSNRVRYMLRGARAFDDLVAARDAAEAANRAKSEFLANMSHELRTPLNAIIGFASIMQQGIRGPIDSRYVDDAKIIVNSGSHLLAIINDILDIAKAEANLLELSEDMVDIAETVAFSADMVAEMAKNGGIVCSYAVDNGLPAFWGDAKKLRQVLINLLSNAVKFTPAGGSVTVSACREDDGGVALRIADTGIGVAPGDIPVALAPFGQVDGTVTRRYEGVGLGLPLSKRLVEMHDGVFEIDSEPGEGTTITVRLPAKRFPGETVKPANAKAYAD